MWSLGIGLRLSTAKHKPGVHRLDAPEAQTAMRAAAAFRQQRQRLHVAAFDLSRRRQFLEFFFHKSLLISRPISRMALLKLVSGQKPREIVVRVLQQRRAGGGFIEDLLETALY